MRLKDMQQVSPVEVGMGRDAFPYHFETNLIYDLKHSGRHRSRARSLWPVPEQHTPRMDEKAATEKNVRKSGPRTITELFSVAGPAQTLIFQAYAEERAEAAAGILPNRRNDTTALGRLRANLDDPQSRLSAVLLGDKGEETRREEFVTILNKSQSVQEMLLYTYRDLVVRLARAIQSDIVSFDEKVQAGMRGIASNGLLTAIDKFNPSNGNDFRAYVNPFVVGAIRDLIAETRDLIRRPQNSPSTPLNFDDISDTSHNFSAKNLEVISMAGPEVLLFGEDVEAELLAKQRAQDELRAYIDVAASITLKAQEQLILDAYRNGLAPKEIAQLLNMNYIAVVSSLRNIKKYIKNYLTGHTEESQENTSADTESGSKRRSNRTVKVKADHTNNAISGMDPVVRDAFFETLSPREREVAELMFADGVIHSNQEIAEALQISPGTVRINANRIRNKKNNFLG